MYVCDRWWLVIEDNVFIGSKIIGMYEQFIWICERTTFEDLVVWKLKLGKFFYCRHKKEDEKFGRWSGDGCSLFDKNETHTICKCDHLTKFSIMFPVAKVFILGMKIYTYPEPPR